MKQERHRAWEGEPKSHSPRNELTKTSMTSLSSNFGCSNRKGCADRMNETKGVNENPVHPSPKKKFFWDSYKNKIKLKASKWLS